MQQKVFKKKKKHLPRAPAAESNALHHRNDDLEQEYEEEHHEVEWRIAPEGLVDRPVPADEAERRQQHEVEDGETEGGHAETAEHEGHAPDYV